MFLSSKLGPSVYMTERYIKLQRAESPQAGIKKSITAGLLRQDVGLQTVETCWTITPRHCPSQYMTKRTLEQTSKNINWTGQPFSINFF